MAEIWWDTQLASPADEYWKKFGMPKRGAYGGRCNHPSCRVEGADWYNKVSGKYYCDGCARKTNEMCMALGQPKLCELHI